MHVCVCILAAVSAPSRLFVKKCMKSFFFRVGSQFGSFLFCFRPFSFKQFTTCNSGECQTSIYSKATIIYTLYAVNLLFATGLWHEICVRFEIIATIMNITMHITRARSHGLHTLRVLHWIAFSNCRRISLGYLYWFYATGLHVYTTYSRSTLR